MIVKLGTYRKNVEFIRALWDKGGNTVNDFVPKASIATDVPCIVVAHYLGEYIGFNEELQEKIKVLVDFYGYTAIEE